VIGNGGLGLMAACVVIIVTLDSGTGGGGQLVDVTSPVLRCMVPTRGLYKRDPIRGYMAPTRGPYKRDSR